jgi:hypothetical protein
MMGALKSYFSYTAYLKCGIPSVTLEGTREDYVKLRDATTDITKLLSFAPADKEWSKVPSAVLNRFVETYDHLEALKTTSF